MTDMDSNHNLPDKSCGQRFLRLYHANERRIYGFILTLVPDWSQAEDLMQEVIEVMWSKFDQYEPGTDFISWALRIARYRVLNHYKKKRTQRLQFSSEVIKDIDDRVVSATNNMDDYRDALYQCLKKLSSRDQQIVHLRYQLNATPRSVADRIGRGVDAVYKALNRIHTQLLHCVRRTLAREELT